MCSRVTDLLFCQHVDIRGTGVAASLASRDYVTEQGLPESEFDEVLSEEEDNDEEEGDGYDTDNAVSVRTGWVVSGVDSC